MRAYTEANVQAIYRCPICEKEYASQSDALACANSTAEPTFKPGDIVTFYPRFGWYDGDARWVIKHGPEKFHDIVLYHFWWVVTAVDFEEQRHRARYHVATKAMRSQNALGYTFDAGHIEPTLVWRNGKLVGKPRVPKFIIEDSRDLVGRVATALI